MNTTFTSALDAIYDSLNEAQAKIRIGEYIIERAATSGRMQRREETELGTVNRTEMNVRLNESLEDERYPLTIGRIIEVNHADRGWERVRIAGRKTAGGIIMLDVETPFE
jgi:hypothetical protein